MTHTLESQPIGHTYPTYLVQWVGYLLYISHYAVSKMHLMFNDDLNYKR